MLTKEDESWLFTAYPQLVPSKNGVAGTIEFKAAYNSETGRFLILPDGTDADGVGTILSSRFNVRIEQRTSILFSILPAVYVEDVAPLEERHFSQADKSACLCSPFHEQELLKPQFQFKRFLEELVIPFLYGQTFYSTHQRWPWAEYSHGATGLLEAYLNISDESRAEECLTTLAKDRNWSRIESALQQKPHIKGHIPCFCPKQDHIRRCHPKALQGLLQLQRDIRALGTPIAKEPEVKNVSLNPR
jgi:hypothetical protein